VGGRRESLKPEGSGVPTTDPDVAEKLSTQRASEPEMKRKDKGLFGVAVEDRGLATYAFHHLETKARDGEVARRWLVELERHLRAAIEHFGTCRTLRSITPGQCSEYVQVLLQRPGLQGGGASRRRQPGSS
jgi:hypothetical protein